MRAELCWNKASTNVAAEFQLTESVCRVWNVFYCIVSVQKVNLHLLKYLCDYTFENTTVKSIDGCCRTYFRWGYVNRARIIFGISHQLDICGEGRICPTQKGSRLLLLPANEQGGAITAVSVKRILTSSNQLISGLSICQTPLSCPGCAFCSPRTKC